MSLTKQQKSALQEAVKGPLFRVQFGWRRGAGAPRFSGQCINSLLRRGLLGGVLPGSSKQPGEFRPTIAKLTEAGRKEVGDGVTK